tara:strand:- start:8851 stop:9198 length:348 start_codon:yes stop_codon:yes gene_type:complete
MCKIRDKNRNNANLALKHRLYSRPDWEMRPELEQTVEDGKSTCTLYFKDGVPVGCAIRGWSSNLIMVFVRKSYRKQGIGSKLVNRVKTGNSWGCSDSPSNGKIFQYNGISVDGRP